MKVQIHLAARFCVLASLVLVTSVQAAALNWTEQEIAASDGAANEGLGRGVAMFGDTAFVGAPGAAAGGAVYVFTRGSDGVWAQTQKLNAAASPDGADFGISIALSADTAVIGADRTTLTDDGNRHQGKVYVFSRGDDGQWTQAQALTASDFMPEAQFGNAVALSGPTILVGAYNTMVGDNAYQGAAYVFTLADGVWSETRKLVADDGIGGDDFGNAVALDGTRAVVGAFYGSGAVGQSGTAYVFESSDGTWTQTAKLSADDGAFFDSFAMGVALSGDTVIVTSQYAQVGDNSGQGAAYVFAAADGSWNQVQKLLASDGAMSDGFGSAIAIDGNQVVIGAASASSYAGAAYVYARAGGDWSELGKLVASDGAESDNFGYSVALSDASVLVGAPLRQVGDNSSQGAAYLYTQPAAETIFADGFESATP